MITTRNVLEQTWTDLNSPSKEELDSLVMSENIDPAVAKDLLAPTPKQIAKGFGNSIYAIFHIPSFRHKNKESFEQEVDFIISEKSLITARYDNVDAIHQFSKEVEVDEILNKNNLGDSHLFFGVTREIYKFLFDEIDYIKDWLREIEKGIFEGKEKEMVFGISAVGRNLLGFKRTIGSHQSVWQNLIQIGTEKYGDKFGRDALSLFDECKRLLVEIENTSLMLAELRETNNSILSTKQNEIMKIFTILAFVTFPLSLVAAIFGMNTAHIPIVGDPNDFWKVLGIMAMMSLAMFSYFKYKKWI